MLASIFGAVGFAAAAAVIAKFIVFTVPTGQPQLRLDQGTFTGVRDDGIDRFLGIPYAKPPVGDLRFRLPVANAPYSGVYNATNFGYSCHQQNISFNYPDNFAPEAKSMLESFGVPLPESNEDCLTLNVWKPSEVEAGTKLPVVIWIHGGGFEVGSAASFDGSVIVKRSLEMGKPILYVGINYRLSAFGFLPGVQAKDAGVTNLGMHDQREAFRWVQRYISAFNGDPSKVTIWGQSAGAWSIGVHMVANGGNTEGLFQGAFMQSGSAAPYGDVSNGQEYYDKLVADSGCDNATDSLQCLREVPSSVIQTIMDSTPHLLSKTALNIVWAPRSDGSLLVDPPFLSVHKGAVADIPFVSGAADDEGTLFALAQTDIITENDVREFVSSNYFPNANDAEISRLLALYPQDLSQGSPFDTGDRNALTLQYKRLAALQGDLLFTAPKRFLLQQRSDKQPAWSFLSKRMKSFPDLGSLHSHDLANIYGPGDLTDYLVNFVNTLNPNGGNLTHWSRYTAEDRATMMFLDGSLPRKLERDDAREDPINYIISLWLKYSL